MAEADAGAAGAGDSSRRRCALAAFVLLAAAYGASRLFHLCQLPMFFDEATYILWAARLRQTGHLLRSVPGGKLLHVVLITLGMLLPGEPLWSARLMSALAGFGSLAAAAGIALRCFGLRCALIAATLYIACPFALLYERIALADALVCAFTGLSLLASLVLLDDPSPRHALALALALSGAVLAKAPGLLAFALPLAAAGLLRARGPSPGKALVLAYAVAGTLVAAPLGYFLLTTQEIGDKSALGDGFTLALFTANAASIALWLGSYWTPPLLALGCAGILEGTVRRRRETLLLLCAAMLFPLAFAALGRSLFPRYVLPATVPFVVLAARGVSALAIGLSRAVGSRVSQGVLEMSIAALALLPALGFDVLLLLDPARAPLPAIERFQLVEGWPSGYGWREVRAFLETEATRHGAIAVVSEADHPYLAASFLMDRRVQVRGLDLDGAPARALAGRWAQGRPTYLVTTADRPPDYPGLHAEHVAGYAKPGGQVLFGVYRLAPAPP